MKCLKCGSENLHKNGKRKGIPAYRCKDCGYQMTKYTKPTSKVNMVQLFCKNQ